MSVVAATKEPEAVEEIANTIVADDTVRNLLANYRAGSVQRMHLNTVPHRPTDASEDGIGISVLCKH